jgi:hypothetical protein
MNLSGDRHVEYMSIVDKYILTKNCPPYTDMGVSGMELSATSAR